MMYDIAFPNKTPIATTARTQEVGVKAFGNQTVAAGYSFSAVLKNDGTLLTFGDNYLGNCGVGSDNFDYILRPIPIMKGVVSISAGALGAFVGAIKEDGSLWMWGDNRYGQIGFKPLNKDSKFQYKPKKIMDDVASVSAGGKVTMAIKKNGSLWEWGFSNEFKSASKIKPKKIMDGVIDVKAGYDHILITKADGSLWASGGFQQGQLGVLREYAEDIYALYEISEGTKIIKLMDNVAIPKRK